jgi:drug/metabolite transporter (DMT)-like permease
MLLFTYGVRLIPAAESALLSFIETIAAPIWVFVFFDENPGLRALLGGAVVLLTVIVYTSVNIRRQAQLAAIG